ncbi:MAG: NFACT family protein [Oscillospiraceae bacterium]|nr:NFACT family protein [Oscillospiraceae bacterium]
MPLDAVALTGLTAELNESIVGSKIDKINMPERDLVILSLHSRESGKQKLLLCARPGSARLHLTEQSYENPSQPPMFCMLLRKYLTGARITAVVQPPFERMVTLELDSSDELGVVSRKRLVMELMGRYVNLVLIGEDGRILDCLRRADYETNERRPLLPGLFYAEPPVETKPCFFMLTAEERLSLYERSSAEREPDQKLLDTFGGLSPLICRELASSSNLPAAMDALAAMAEQGSYRPTLLREGARPRDFSFTPIYQYGSAVKNESYCSFSELLDAFYAQRELQELIRRRSSELQRTAKTARDRLARKLDARQRELKATEKREEYRRTADLITANLYRLKRGERSFEAQDFYEEDCPTVTVSLDPRKTPQQNAAAYYKLYNKAKTANRVLTELIAGSEEEIAYLDSVLHELSRAECDRDLSDIRRELIAGGYLKPNEKERRAKTPAPRKPLRFLTDSGMEVLVGRGNEENDRLTLHTARRTDLWLHVQKIPGSHVILSQQEKQASEQDILQAAVLAATYSQSGGGKTAVDCTLVRFVKKPAGARPGRVIYTDQKTYIVEPDAELAARLRQKD